ncbi:lipid II flippase MurJ [Spongiactinospora sp. TRM90649]|uniref:murein biosynthesis integral membrane protein MurJ n=1 Tax=Spongiactinospora sp. TRM90649 TaxID=3031114 RepID=UPI0023F8FD8E|nr:lipid II flippase MurJ [Spongiactinospora sp. TRM90649]MDF5759223.1 lipid II flippase MurJ [Spongiactinospora sp. TRM90649]
MLRRLGQGVAGAAVLIGVLTVAARLAGFGKQLALARTVGTNCLSTAYFTANHIPNMVFEVVVGGALAGMVVPVLAGFAARAAPSDRAAVSGVTSALLTWVVAALVPLAVLAAFAAAPVIRLFVGPDLPGCDTGAVVETATRMLVVFAPQIPLYGVAVVLYGVLQAHRRFAAPALAPLVSSLVVIAAYLIYVPLRGDAIGLPVPGPAELALSAGTTLGVLAMVLTVIGPASRLGLRLRPTFRFPEGVGPTVRRLALAGLAALLAQQAAMALTVVLANRGAGPGAIVAYNYAWAIYQVPYAVLAVPIATSAFPLLSTRAQHGDTAGFAATAAATSRAVILVSGLAAGLLGAVAVPVAGVFLDGAASDVDPGALARAIALFAPGLAGYGLIAHLSRVLYAAGRGRAAAVGTVGGWLAVMVAQTVFTLVLPPDWRLAGLALGGTLGMSAGGVTLAVAVLRARGAAALRGAGRSFAAAVLGGLAAYLAGSGVTAFAAAGGVWLSVLNTVLAAVVAAVAGAMVVMLVDGREARALLARVRRGRRTGTAGTAETIEERVDG